MEREGWREGFATNYLILFFFGSGRRGSCKKKKRLKKKNGSCGCGRWLRRQPGRDESVFGFMNGENPACVVLHAEWFKQAK